MAATRTATVTWNGNLATGSGTVTAGSSELFTDLPVSWSARTEAPAGPDVAGGAARRGTCLVLLDGALRGARPRRHAT